MTQGSQVVKPNVRKVRRIGENAIGGFAGPAPVAVRAEEAVFISFHIFSFDLYSAGATADAFTLFEELEVPRRLICTIFVVHVSQLAILPDQFFAHCFNTLNQRCKVARSKSQSNHRDD